MPTVPDEFVPYRVGRPLAAEAPAEAGPGTLPVLGAAGTVANWPYRAWRYLANRDEVVTDPEHNPFDLIKGTKYETDPERFAYSRNADETRAIMQEWDEDDAAIATLSRSGRFGTVAMVGMGLLDPTIFVPVAKVFSGAAAGYRALRIGGDVALASGLTAAVGEGVMAGTTPHYSGEDMALGIGTSTLLGGLLGTAAGALMSRAEKQTLVKSLQADREEWGADIAPPRPSAPAPAAAGAAASDTRALELRNLPGLSKVPDPTAKLSPPRRVLNAPFQAGRRATVDLVETPYIFRENDAGVATTQGPALDRLAKLEVNKARVGLAQKLDDAYTRYRFGGAPETWRDSLGNRATRLMDYTGRPREKASIPEFRSMVDDAMRNNDSHAIPEVAEMAKYIRDTVIVPWRDRAIKAGLLGEDVDVKTADSYMMRVWNKQRLIGERPRAVQIFADWLDGEEAKKAALQDKIRLLQGDLDTAAASMEKLRGQRNKKLGENAAEIDQKLGDLESYVQARRAMIEEAVTAWEGKSAKAAKRALDKRPVPGGAEGQAGGAGADAAVDLAVKRILGKERLRDRKEIEALAQEIVDRITGGPDGRLPYDAPAGRSEGFSGGNQDARGPLAARDFMIPDNLVRDFIDTDVHNTAEIYLNTMVPDVLLTERFGDVRMTETFRRINEEASAMEMAAKTPAERLKIQGQRDAVIADLAAMRDRIRHTYGFSSDPRNRFMGRIAATAARYDVLTNLGGAALSSLSDLAGIQWQAGLRGTFRHAWAPFFKAMVNPETRKAVLQYRRQLQTLGIAAETYLSTRASGIHDVLDVYRPTSRFERGMRATADKFGNITGLSQWTDFGKMAAGMVSGGEISSAVEAIGAGKASERQIRRLAEGGIDAAMAARIDKALKADGGSDVVAGIRIPNSGNWADTGARDAFEGALARDVDIMIITPGAERPLMMSKPIAALILQYKSFVAAANERLLVRSLQSRDRQVLEGMVSAIGLGMLAEYAYSGIAGRDPPVAASEWIKQGISRAGLLGWYQEANAISAKWTGGAADAYRLIGAKRPDSRYYSRSTLGAILGPTANKVESLIYTSSDIANLDWKAADTRRLRRMLIGQNVFYIRGLLDSLEAGANAAAGVEPLPDNNQ